MIGRAGILMISASYLKTCANLTELLGFESPIKDGLRYCKLCYPSPTKSRGLLVGLHGINAKVFCLFALLLLKE